MRGISTGAYEEERDDWNAAVGRAAAEGHSCLELCAIIPSLLDSLAVQLAGGALHLDSFERISVHAPVGIRDADHTVSELLLLPLDSDVVLHPDLYGRSDAVAVLGRRAVFENMDVAKSFGRTVADLRSVFERFLDAGFCLDVAHVWTNDPTLALGHDLLDSFGDRLRQLHVSGIEPNGTHRPTTEADLALYEPLLGRCEDVPWVFESVVI